MSKKDSFKNMSSSQIQQEITKTEKQMENFISNSQYPEAEKCNDKIEILKKLLKSQKTEETKHKHETEKQNLQNNHTSQTNNLNNILTEKFRELEIKTRTSIEELKKKQNEEMENLYSKYKEENGFIKPSSMYLKLCKEEEGLVKLRKFKEAEVIRKQKEAQKLKDINRSCNNKGASLKSMEEKLKQKHDKELLFLKSKLKSEYDELEREGKKEMEFLNKKYSAKNKDLINQQKRENNFNKNNNYKKRNEKLHKDYEMKNVYDKKEYEPNEEHINVEHICAEIIGSKIQIVDLDKVNSSIEK